MYFIYLYLLFSYINFWYFYLYCYLIKSSNFFLILIWNQILLNIPLILGREFSNFEIIKQEIEFKTVLYVLKNYFFYILVYYYNYL